MLRHSSIVVVLWSLTSVKSKWVRAEATLGERSSVVIPAMIEDAERPILFELTQTADLIDWAGDRTEQRWIDFVSDIRKALDTTTDGGNEPAPTPQVATTSDDDDPTIETVFWTSIKDGENPADFEAYLKRYPSGHYSDLARNRLAALGTQQTLSSQPVAPPPTPLEQVSSQSATGSSSKLMFAALGVFALAAIIWGASSLFSGTDGEVQTDADTGIVAQTCANCPEMVALPGGTFLMGSANSEPNRTGNEGPQRDVSIPDFNISKSEITHSQWMLCVEAGSCRAPVNDAAGNMPISMVSWNDAQDYTRWLTSTTGETYRLPTEAEWEYAARAGTQTAYWWGSDFQSSPTQSNVLQDVAALPENPFGLVGVHGNLREWVEDCYVNNYTSAPTNGTAVLQGNCNNRVVRGGAYSTGPAEQRAANRARFAVSTRDKSLGFRVVQEPKD